MNELSLENIKYELKAAIIRSSFFSVFPSEKTRVEQLRSACHALVRFDQGHKCTFSIRAASGGSKNHSCNIEIQALNDMLAHISMQARSAGWKIVSLMHGRRHGNVRKRAVKVKKNE